MKPPETTILFAGTPIFARPAFERLLDAGYRIAAVLTKPDQPAGRGKLLTPPPMKQAAAARGIPVLQFPRLTTEVHTELAAYQPDVIVVAAYGLFLPASLLGLPRFGCLNIHPSLLPRYRGPSPIQTAIKNGDRETGVSIMLLDEEMDHGPLLGQRTVPILGDEDASSLENILACEGAELLGELLPRYLDGTLTPTPQDHSQATTTTLFGPADAKINWAAPAAVIEAHIRAYAPEPGAWTDITGERLKILKAHLEDGKLRIDRVQPPGKPVMDYRDFLNGHQPLPTA